ncbi:MAG: hypothetical protein WDN10_02725 [bacterium]
MRKIFAALLVFTTLLATGAEAAAKDVSVRGYVRKDGTYVPPHHRSSPDSNPYNNYSTYPNVNPYTGEQGHKRVDPYSSPSGSSRNGTDTNNPYDPD